MKIYTYLEARQKLERDLDLEEEDFVSTEELIGYFNDGIDEAEAEILNMWQGYFKRSGTLNLLPDGNSQSVVASDGVPDLVLTSASHGLAVNDRVKFTATSFPGGIVADTVYWVVSVPSSSTFKVSATKGGTAIAYVSAGSGVNLVYQGKRYLLPDDIYATKLMYIEYNDGGTNIYKVRKVRNKDANYIDTNLINEDYMFDIEHVDSSIGPEIVLYPTSRDKGRLIKYFYIRNANRIVDDTTKIDIPEFMSFLWAYVKVRVALKELHPLLQALQADLEKQRTLMRETLDNMIPDEDEQIQPDLSFYEDYGLDEMYGRLY